MANYLREPYSSDLDFGTGEWSVGSWVNIPTSNASAGTILSRSYSTGPSITLSIDATSKIVATVSDGSNQRTVTTDASYNSGTWIKAEATYKSGKLAILVNGVEVKSTVGSPLLSLNSRYNLLTYTEQFDNSAWYKGNILAFGAGSIADTTETTDPLGTNTADKIVVASGSNIKVMRPATWPAVAAGTVLSGSVYLKAGTHPYASVAISQSTTGSIFAVATINLSTGVITKTGTGGSGGTIVGTPAAISIGNGWYRVTISGSYPSGTNAVLWIMPAGSATPTYDASNFGADTWSAIGTENIYVWGAQLEVSSAARTYQRVGAATDFDFQAPLTIGNSYDTTSPFPGSLALVKLSATVPTAEQALWMYNQEKQMFQPNAQVTLPDSNAIQDISYDDLTDTWVAASTTNTSYWNGLVRTNSVAVPAGTYSKLVSGSGMHLSARITTNPGVDITIPDYKIKSKIKKKSEKGKKKTVAVFDYTPVQFTNATLTNGSNVMTCTAANVSGTPYIGMTITASVAGLAAGTTITGIVTGTPNTYYLSNNFTGTTGSTYTVGQASFDVPVGYTTNLVYSGGSLKREGSAKDYTRLFDGFKEIILFGVSPGTSQVQLHCQTQ